MADMKHALRTLPKALVCQGKWWLGSLRPGSERNEESWPRSEKNEGTKKLMKKDHEERIFFQKKSTFGFRGEGKLGELLEKEKGRSNKNTKWGGGERRQDRAQQGSCCWAHGSPSQNTTDFLPPYAMNDVSHIVFATSAPAAWNGNGLDARQDPSQMPCRSPKLRD